MGLEIPPLKFKIMLESNPPKTIMLVLRGKYIMIGLMPGEWLKKLRKGHPEGKSSIIG